MWGTHHDGRASRVGQLHFDYEDSANPQWFVEAVWPEMPWAEIFVHDPWIGFVFVRSSEEDDGAHGFVDGPIEEGSHLVVPPIERAFIEGSLPGEIAVDVGGKGHVGLLWLQDGADPFLEHSRYRIYSAPHEPLVLDAWPTLPGGLTIQDLDLEGSWAVRATVGVSDPHGNPGWMHRPVSEQRTRRLFVGTLVAAP